MAPEHCTRCGRLPPVTGLGQAGGASPPMQRGLESVWASIHGEVVCPDCQTPEERREACQRSVVAWEQETARRRSEGIPPDPYEAAVFAHVPASPSYVSAAAEDPAPAADTESLLGSASDARRLSVAFTGAFLTGYPL